LFLPEAPEAPVLLPLMLPAGLLPVADYFEDILIIMLFLI
jgi:hypothetical protein